MSTLYARLIELALGTSLEQPILAIVSNLAEDQRVEREATGDLSFPREYLPVDADVRFLPADEHYVDRVKTLLTEIGPVRVFLAPPLRNNRDLSDYLRLQYPRMNLESIAFQVAIESLPTGSQVAVTLPASFLQNESSRSVRANVFGVAPPQILLTHLPSLHEMGLPVHPAFRMSTIIAKVGAGGSPLRFFRGEAASATGDLVADFTRLLHQGGGRTRYGYVIREGLPVDAPLLYDLYDPKIVDRRRSLAALGQVQRLGDLADILLGINVVAKAEFLKDGSPLGFVGGSRPEMNRVEVNARTAEHE